MRGGDAAAVRNASWRFGIAMISIGKCDEIRLLDGIYVE
jgi:hypothetical protein